MKSLSIISIFVTAALAQSSSSGTSSNPLIPGDISAECNTFLTKFNTDPGLTACTASLTESTKNFGPGGSNTSPSKTEVIGSLGSICSEDSACPDNLMRTQLTEFYAACLPELTTSRNQKVLDIYEVLYVLTPLKRAICSKDDNGEYCLLPGSEATASGIKGAITNSESLDLQDIQAHLSKNAGTLTRRAADAVVANLTTFQTNNLAFLFRQPTMESAALCTVCTRNIITAYFSFEADVMYAPGLFSSTLLKGQDALLGAVGEKCGANFLNSAVQAAGGIQAGILGSGAAQDKVSSLLAVVAGAFTVAISAIL